MQGIKLALEVEGQGSGALCLVQIRCRYKFRCISESIKAWSHEFFGIKENFRDHVVYKIMDEDIEVTQRGLPKYTS